MPGAFVKSLRALVSVCNNSTIDNQWPDLYGPSNVFDGELPILAVLPIRTVCTNYVDGAIPGVSASINVKSKEASSSTIAVSESEVAWICPSSTVVACIPPVPTSMNMK